LTGADEAASGIIVNIARKIIASKLIFFILDASLKIFFDVDVLIYHAFASETRESWDKVIQLSLFDVSFRSSIYI